MKAYLFQSWNARQNQVAMILRDFSEWAGDTPLGFDVTLTSGVIQGVETNATESDTALEITDSSGAIDAALVIDNVDCSDVNRIEVDYATDFDDVGTGVTLDVTLTEGETVQNNTVEVEAGQDSGVISVVTAPLETPEVSITAEGTGATGSIYLGGIRLV